MVPTTVVPLAAFPADAQRQGRPRAGCRTRNRLPVAADRRAAPPSRKRRLVEYLGVGITWTSPSVLDDGFFDLGGHSLLAIRVLARMREDVRRRGAVAASSSPTPTVAGLSRLRGCAAPGRCPCHRWCRLRSPSAAAPVPLSFAQQRMWILDQLDPTGAAYVIQSAQHIRGPLDVPMLAGAHCGRWSTGTRHCARPSSSI